MHGLVGKSSGFGFKRSLAFTLTTQLNHRERRYKTAGGRVTRVVMSVFGGPATTVVISIFAWSEEERSSQSLRKEVGWLNGVEFWLFVLGAFESVEG